jgi:hypothetical protein
MQRIGECVRCGSCCSSEEGFPVPKNFPEAIRNWRVIDIEDKHIPHLSVLGLGENTDGSLKRVSNTFTFNLTGYKVEGLWVEGHGLCKNITPLDDENAYELTCPFLEDEKFGRRECALAGTQYENFYIKLCGDMAPETFTQEERDTWLSNHPLCGYDWE